MGIGSNLNVYNKGFTDGRNEVRNPIFLLRVKDSKTSCHKTYVYIWREGGCRKIIGMCRGCNLDVSNRLEKPSLLNQIIEFKLLHIQYICLAVITGKTQQICWFFSVILCKYNFYIPILTWGSIMKNMFHNFHLDLVFKTVNTGLVWYWGLCEPGCRVYRALFTSGVILPSPPPWGTLMHKTFYLTQSL